MMNPELDREFLRVVGEAPGQVPEHKLVLRASQIFSRVIKWAWAGRLALGYLTVQTGEEGLGKSVFDAWLVARATRGDLDGVWRGRPVDVLVVAGEDGLRDTWIPRLTLAGANLDRVGFLNLDGLPFDWNVRDGIQDVRRALTASAGGLPLDAQLIVFDALLDHMPAASGGENINSPTFVRGALAPLRDLVKELRIVGLFSMHPPKSRGSSFRDLVQASQAFSAIPRIGLFFGWHPDDPEDDPERRRVVVRGKGNIGRNPGALEFRITGRDLCHGDGETQEREVIIDVVESDVTLSWMLARPREAGPDRDSKAQRAAEIMRAELATGDWRGCSGIRDQLDALGLDHNQTVQTAKILAGVESRKQPGSLDGQWEWRIIRARAAREESYPSAVDSSGPDPAESPSTKELSEESTVGNGGLFPVVAAANIERGNERETD